MQIQMNALEKIIDLQQKQIDIIVKILKNLENRLAALEQSMNSPTK
jgi:hypothetical protein